jgi:hypothetical protein
MKKLFLIILMFCALVLHLDAQNVFKVQRGISNIPDGATSISIDLSVAPYSPVASFQKAFVRITNSHFTGAGTDTGGVAQYASNVACNIQFDSLSQITITRFGSLNRTRVYWEIVEYTGPSGGDNEFIVRDQGVLPFIDSSNTAAKAYSSWTGASVSKLVGFITGISSSSISRSYYNRQLVTASFNSPTELLLTRNVNGSIIEVSYAVVDYVGSNWSVQRIEHNYNLAGTDESETLSTPVNLANTFIHAQKRNPSTANRLRDFGHQVWLSNSNTLNFRIYNGSIDPSGQYSVAWLISNPDMTVSHVSASRAKNTGSEPDIFNITIPTLSSLDNASLFITNTCSGPGTYFPRPMLGCGLNSITDIELFRSDNGQNQYYKIDSVDWPIDQFKITGTIYNDESKTTTVSGGISVALSVNGAPVISTTTQIDGTFAFSLTSNPNPDDVILVYIDNNSLKSSLVTLSDGVTSLSGTEALELIVDHVVLEHQTGTEITNSDLDLIDNVDSDALITIDASLNATFATGNEVWISPGSTYIPGADVTLDGLSIFGTFNPETYQVTVNSEWMLDPLGTFNSDTSNVIFSGAATALISGNSTFYNLSCNAPSKQIAFTASSTQTINGKFLIDGNNFPTRIKLFSSAGGGTTWNIVFNGTYDCRYVAVQGSIASGTAYLPVLPVAFKDNGDNTNWYSSTFPREMLFYDNFETSTLGSTPPNKTSSYWTINNTSWLTAPSEVVDNQNRTLNGSQSMFSVGGNAGDGIGVWNYPAWGSVQNASAQAWFYDDLQNNKKQWLFLDNAAGSQGIGVLVETDKGQGAVKYRYCSFGITTTAYYDTYIDRTIGWHHVQWVHSDGDIELYLDGALLIRESGLTDFSDFDTGSWNWHNTNGSTPMWFDDFMVYRSLHLSHYRWCNNDSAQNPAPVDSEDTAIEWNINEILRLRVQLVNDMYDTWDNAFISLQYKEGLRGAWENLDASAAWNYADGLATDKAMITNSILSSTNVNQTFIESLPSASATFMNNLDAGEWDFSIIPNSNAAIGTVYFFRVVITDNTGTFLKKLGAYQVYPECKVMSSNLWVWTGRFNTDWNNRFNWSTNSVPNASSDVIIPNNARRDCSVNISNAVCHSLMIEDARQLLLDVDNTDLTVTKDITVYGKIIHSNDTASLTLQSGRLLIDGSLSQYLHSGNGPLIAVGADINLKNSAQYLIQGTPAISSDNINLFSGSNFKIDNAASIEVTNIKIDLNSQFESQSTSNTIDINGDFFNDGSMFSNTGGIFRFHNTGNIEGSSSTTKFYNAEFLGDTTITTLKDITVINDLDITSGNSLSASSGNLLLGGNWNNNSGTFVHGNGTVIFNGTALQTVTADSSSFNRMLITNSSTAGIVFADSVTTNILENKTPGSTMAFSPGTTFTIAGNAGMIIEGTSGNEINLLSTVPGTFWEINPLGGAWTIDAVAVQDSVNIFEDTIYPTNSIDNGNTINWFSYDIDKDELPDYWEYIYYGSLVNGAVSDTDNDGLSAFEENVLKTNPTVANPSSQTLYVDCHAGYYGNGSSATPFKYLEDALSVASDGMLISLLEGVYVIDNYNLNKRVLIRSAGRSSKTIIHPLASNGNSSDLGQAIQIENVAFMLSNVTLRHYLNDEPIVSYSSLASSKNRIVFNNVIFKENLLSSKSLISFVGTHYPKDVYMLNCSVFNNSAAAFVNLQASRSLRFYNNTVVDNTFNNSLILNASGRFTFIYNNILRNGGSEILNNSTGPQSITIANCNIEGGFSGSINSYDSPESFANTSTGAYQILPASPGINAGVTTGILWDINNNIRPQGSAFELGAYEMNPLDSDSDGLLDNDENTAGTDSLKPDSDSDGLNDGDEVHVYLTNPLNNNTDGDFILDGEEPAMGMNPAVHDGVGDIAGVYYTSFENDSLFPVGPLANTIWGPTGNPNSSIVIKGHMTIENVGATFAFNGVKVAKAAGEIPESSFIGWIDRNSLDDYWISIAWKTPRAKLPTDINEAFNMAGAFMAVDENGFLNIWDPNSETWRKDVLVSADDWIPITVHRDHPGRTVDVWIAQRQVFAGVPITGPDPTAGTGKFRMSMSSVGQFDSYTDLWSSLPYSPF